MKKIVIAFAVSFAALAGCNALIGTRDLYLGDAGASGDATTADVITSRDGGDGAVSNCKEGDPSLQTDKANCGRCGHDCLGGECTAGVCKAVRISAENKVFGLALLEDKVYFTANAASSIYRMKKDGTEPVKLAASSSPWGITVDKDAVYWVNDAFAAPADAGASAGALFECKHTGCGPNGTYLAEASRPVDVAVSGNQLFFSENSGASLKRYTKGGGLLEVASQGQPFKLATDGTHVYYLSGASSLYRVPVGGGTAEAVGPAPGNLVGGGVAVGGGRVFWTSMSSAVAGTVRSASTANTGDQIAYPNDGLQPFCITADAKNVYWGTLGSDPALSMGALYTCPITGCANATVLVSNLGGVEDVEVDDTGIYFGLFSGGIFRLAKP